MNWAALLAGLFSGIAAAMGLGGGAVLVIYLAIFTDTAQHTSQGINLLFFIPIGLAAVTVYGFKKEIKWKLTLKIAAFGMLGTLIGSGLTEYFGGGVTEKIFGALLLIIGLSEIFTRGEKTVDKKRRK